MVAVSALPQSLADGMTICASLPITVNMVLVLTKSAGGDEAAAIFNAAFGNFVGVFLSPALILMYLGVHGQTDRKYCLQIGVACHTTYCDWPVIAKVCTYHQGA